MEKEEIKSAEEDLMDEIENLLDPSESAFDKSDIQISKSLSTNSGKKRKLTQEERDHINHEREVKRMALQKEKEEKAEKKRLEKERLQKQREEEKERKRLEDEEAKRKKEEELERKRLEQEEIKKKKEEEKERKRREEEEVKRKKEEEIERRRMEQEEGRKKKDEEKERKRREEEQRKEQKRRQEEEVEIKKKRMSQSFISFFQKIDKTEPPPTLPMPANSRFKPFEIKEGMTLAPIHRRLLLSPASYNSLLQTQMSEKTDYLVQITKEKSKKRKTSLPDVIPLKSLKAKLFQFHDNYRHPYYGTWRKRSRFVTGRRPFSTLDKDMDYEYDSDQDWEDDPSDGDECKSDEEDNEKEEVDDEDDEGFFVGHGYLSPGEGSEEEDENTPNRIEKVTDNQRRQRLAHTDQEWKEAQKQKKQKTKGPKKLRLNPTIYGPSWTDPDEDEHNTILQHLMSGVVFNYASINPKI